MLGPLLFSSSLVNDLPSIVRSPLVLFADAAKIYHSIQSDEDRQLLQLSRILTIYVYSEMVSELATLFQCDQMQDAAYTYVGFNQLYKEYKLGVEVLLLQMLRGTSECWLTIKFHEQFSAVI